MGYNTDFEGMFKLNKPLSPEHRAYLKKFKGTRRMKRNVSKLRGVPDPIREAVGLPLGEDGGHFVGSSAMAGQDFDHPSVIDSNTPPNGQPSLWCQWTPTDDGKLIIWDEGENFYEYIEWLQYLINNFLGPWGYTLDGNVKWEGDDPFDYGAIQVTSNKIQIFGPIAVFNEEGEPRQLQVFRVLAAVGLEKGKKCSIALASKRRAS